MSRANTGTNAPRQGIAESVGRIVGQPARIAAVGADTAVGDAIRKILGATAASVGAMADLSDSQRRQLGLQDKSHAWRESFNVDLDAIPIAVGQKPAEALEAYVAGEFAEMSGTFREAMFDQLLPAYDKLIDSTRRTEQKKLYDDSTAAITGRLATHIDLDALAADLTDHVAEGQAIGYSRSEILSHSLLPAAEAAAMQGDTQRVAWLAERADGMFPAKFTAASLRAEAVAAGKAMDAWIGRIDAMNDPISQAPPMIEAVQTDGALSEAQQSELTARLERRRQADVAANRDRIYFGLKQGILYRQAPPEILLGNIEAYGRQPYGDGAGIDPGQVIELKRLLAEQQATDVRKQIVAAKFAGGEDAPPVNPADDSEVLQVMAEGGMGVAIALDENANPILLEVTDPVAWAAAVDKVNYNPKAITESIRRSMASDDPQQVESGMLLYATLQKAAPAVAADVYDGMNDLAKLRAHWLTTQALPAGRDLEAMRTRMAELQPTVMRLRPVDFTREQTDRLLWVGDDTRIVDQMQVLARAREALEDALPAGLEETFAWGSGRDVETPPTAVVNTYRRLADQQFRALVGQGIEQDRAAELAKSQAAALTLQQHTPVLWADNTVIYTSGRGLPVSAHYGGIIMADLMEAAGTDDVDELAEQFRPAWDPAAQAFVLIDGDGAAYAYERDGRIVRFESDPFIELNPETRIRALKKIGAAKREEVSETRVKRAEQYQETQEFLMEAETMGLVPFN